MQRLVVSGAVDPYMSR